ncbi:MAG TPA: hypothetical protein VFU28_24190 [Vicinamibacterales bacterium]|nr:hypothetical protein [Vicinamibacterales bacterium]
MKSQAEKFAAELRELAERLNTCDQVKRYDTAEEKQAWTLAHNLLDLAESCQALLSDLLPKLREGEPDSDRLNTVLLEIGEELRHVLYHIRDSEFYAYLRDQ